MNTVGKRKRRRMSAAGHRERAQRFRQRATHLLQAKAKQELMLSATKHEAIAEELDRSEGDEPVEKEPWRCNGVRSGLRSVALTSLRIGRSLSSWKGDARWPNTTCTSSTGRAT
jgi:hypothetical protein